jgi:hypothetical protein
MSIINTGGQQLTFDFKHPLKGKNFNSLFRDVLPAGIYDGGEITNLGGNQISIAPFVAIFYSEDDVAVKIQTTSAITLSIPAAAPVIHAYFTWSDTIENWADITSRAVATVVTNEIIFGKALFTGSVLTSIDYTDKTWGLITTDVSTSLRGLVPLAPNDTTKFLRGDATWSRVYISKFIKGLTLSNYSTNGITVTAGSCSDSTGMYVLTLNNTTSKYLQNNAAWGAGTLGNGYSGAIVLTAIWYHIFLIRRDSDGVCDVCFHTSLTAPVLPSGYTYFRYLGSLKNTAAGSANILQFVQIKDTFIWKTPTIDRNLGSNGVPNTKTLVTLTSPTNVSCEVLLNVITSNDVGSNYVYFSHPDCDDITPDYTNSVPDEITGGQRKCFTNTSSQIAIKSNAVINECRIQTISYRNSEIY